MHSCALAGDPLSAFGSVLGLNRPVDAATAKVLCEPGLFVEAMAAPDSRPGGLKCSPRGPMERQRPADEGRPAGPPEGGCRAFIEGGSPFKRPTSARRSEERMESGHREGPAPGNGRSPIRFGDRAAVKSNAIVVAKTGCCWGSERDR